MFLWGIPSKPIGVIIVHWIVNYELEKRFEEAKESLLGTQELKDPQELLLFHGTNPANIDSYALFLCQAMLYD